MKTLSSQSFCRLTRVSSIVLCVSALLSVAVPAQAQAPGTRIAVIDISYIFKNHDGFKASMTAMKGDVQAFEGQLKAAGEQIKQLQQQLTSYKPGSVEFKGIEAKILKINADGQAAAALKKRDFLQREAEIYFETYNTVVAEVAAICEQNGISLVVRFNSEPITKERPAILEGVNRAVVYQSKLNITDLVLSNLKRRAVATRPGAVPTPQ